MKAPINFSEKIKGHKLVAGFRNYRLGNVEDGSDNKMWVYPDATTNSVIRVDFNWERHTYTILVARTGNGSNFHTKVDAKEFHPSWFKSFDTFLQLIQTKLTNDWNHHFGY